MVGKILEKINHLFIFLYGTRNGVAVHIGLLV